jgi:hypothetical protein
MNARLLLIVLLVLAAVSVDVAMAVLAHGRRFPSVAPTLLLALALAQTGLLAAWLAVGPGSIAIRYGACVLAVMCFSWPLSNVSLPNYAQWLGVLGVYLTAVAVPVFLFRWFVVELPRRRAEGGSRSRNRLPAGQWTLAGIMSLTTVVAVSLALARAVELPNEELLPVIVACLGFSATTLVALWITCGIERQVWHLPAVLLVCPLIGAVVGVMMGPAPYVGVMAGVALVQSLAVVFFVDVVRMRVRRPTRSDHRPRTPAD